MRTSWLGEIASTSLDSDVKTASVALFVFSIFTICLFLQRFGLTFGDQSLNAVGPIGLALAVVGLACGNLVFNARRLTIYLVMLAIIFVGNAIDVASPLPFVGNGSFGSLLQFVMITGFAVLSFNRAIDEQKFFRLAQKFFLIIAVAGTLQFLAQLAHISVFSFAAYLPPSILVENGWNLEILSGVGDLLKSNGFFLVEPSVMSQFMAIAIAIELLYFRRSIYLTAFIIGLLLSLSGTGGLVLLAFALAATLKLGWRGIALALLLIAMLIIATTLIVFTAPDFSEAIQDRFSEISIPGTSGHMRFVTPFWLLNDMFGRVPAAIFLGIGAGTSEHLTMPYNYDVNTPVKISLEFGIPVFIAYVALFVTGRRTKRQGVLVLPCLVLLMLTGAYQQFAPVVFLIALLLCVARLAESPAYAS